MQQLTERQCWKIIRDLVSDKNKEYSSFLLKIFDTTQSQEIHGYTRDMFLGKFRLYSLAEFNEYARGKLKDKEPNARWLENLACEDLLLFLDFRCRSLQEIYDYYKTNGTINKSDIKDIITRTKISSLAVYNNGKLICGGKPKRVEGELKLVDMELTKNQLNEQALLQIAGKIAGKYASVQKAKPEEAVKLASLLVTSNIDLNGFRTGYKIKGEITLPQVIEEKSSNGLIAKEIKAGERPKSEFKFVDYDVLGNPIFERGGEYCNFFGERIVSPAFANKDELNR